MSYTNSRYRLTIRYIHIDETVIVLFTRRYKIPTRKPPKLNGVELTIKEHTKYLEVILNNKLKFKLSMEERVKKASGVCYASMKMLWST